MFLKNRVLTLVAGFVVTALATWLYGHAILSDYSRITLDYGRAYENAYMGERLNHLMMAATLESRGISRGLA